MSARPYVVAVTGGIASGKTTVTDRLASHGVPVVDADLVSRELVEPGEAALGAIVARFGPVLDASGRLDRRALRERVFGDEAARRDLEAILHPRVRERMRAKVDALAMRSPPPPYVVLAIPLLAEVGRYPWIDRVVVVDVPREHQIDRLTRRDGISRELAESMLAAQATREARLAIADDVIANAGTLEALHARIDALHAALDRFATARASSQ